MDLPSGVVTFLMTDVEGSTRLWAEASEAMRAALARHDAIAASVTEDHAGSLLKSRGEGDSTFSVFARATDAIVAACALQTALTAEPWPEGAPLRVRIAVHTGEADLGVDDYYGIAVNRCARLRSIAHGGQVLVSESTTGLVRELLPEEVGLRDLGYQRLRDLAEPERVSQLLHPSLPSDFPALRTIDLVPNNLPYQVSTFVAREAEMTTIRELLRDTRLLTLSGAGGVGKTRLALQAAAEMLYEYPDGVWVVELAALSDGGLLHETLAAVLDVREEPGRRLAETVVAHLRRKQALLVLDNCEHLVEACAELAEHLTRQCQTIRIMATSREALRAEGETVWRVPSLSVPHRAPGIEPRPEQLTQYAAVRLFVDRAAKVSPGFKLTSENAPAVAEICSRLEGVPLAIELAAARVNMLSVEQIEQRLDERFRLLTGGRRTALPRQQTLEATVRWSYDLLPKREQTLFGRLSVFAGGFTLDAAEAVCAGDGIEAADIADLVGELASKSLVIPGRGRYWMLETLRAYGRQRLDEAGEADGIRRSHAEHFAAVAEQARDLLRGAEQVAWLARLDTEHDNLRAALAWGLQDDVVSGYRLVSAMAQFWALGCHWTEGRRWVDEYLRRAEEAPDGLRADALIGASSLAVYQGDCPKAETLAEEALRLSRETGYDRSVATALSILGNAAIRRGRYDVARARHEESLGMCRGIGDRYGVAVALLNLGWAVDMQGDTGAARAYHEECIDVIGATDRGPVRAQALNNLGNLAAREGRHDEAVAMYEESLALWGELRNDWGRAQILVNLALLVEGEGDLRKARSLNEQALAIMQRLGARRDSAVALRNLAGVMQEEGEYTEAARRYAEAAATTLELGDRHVLLACLEGLAILLQQRGRAACAARIFGAAEALRQEIGASVVSFDPERYAREVRSAREALGEAGFQSAWDAGQAMTRDEAVTYAVEESACEPA